MLVSKGWAGYSSQKHTELRFRIFPATFFTDFRTSHPFTAAGFIVYEVARLKRIFSCLGAYFFHSLSTECGFCLCIVVGQYCTLPQFFIAANILNNDPQDGDHSSLISPLLSATQQPEGLLFISHEYDKSKTNYNICQSYINKSFFLLTLHFLSGLKVFPLVPERNSSFMQPEP